MSRAVLCLIGLILAFAASPSVGLAQTAAEGMETVRQVERPGRSGLPLPRFVTLRASEVNLRTGPGVRYPIDWVYQKRDLPVEIIDEFETWRQIRDHDGTTGWVHQSMLSGRRSVLITEADQVLRREPDAGASGLALLDIGVIGRLERCELGWCRLTVETYSGWLPQSSVFGVYAEETLR